jgi:hypothetical protein
MPKTDGRAKEVVSSMPFTKNCFGSQQWANKFRTGCFQGKLDSL